MFLAYIPVFIRMKVKTDLQTSKHVIHIDIACITAREDVANTDYVTDWRNVPFLALAASIVFSIILLLKKHILTKCSTWQTENGCMHSMYVPLFSLYICVEGQASVRYGKRDCMKLASYCSGLKGQELL